MSIPPSRKLPQYFLLEGLCGAAAIFFLYCAFFWTEKRFGYSVTENLLFISLHGFVYIFISMHGGRLADRIGYDRMISICFLGTALTLGTCWISDWHYAPFILIILFTIFIGPIWPALEASVLHCPGSASMPNRLGIYNITWATGDGIGFALSAIFFKWNADSIVWVPALLYFTGWVWFQFAPRNHGDEGTPAMELAHAGDDVSKDTKQKFMYTAWLGNCLGFMMLSALSALTPDIGRRLNLPPEFTIWLSCTQLFARAAAFALYWKWEKWHYHYSWSQTALWATPISLTIVFFIPNVAAVFIALAVFGAASALSYSGSLYYSMAYGENKGEHGGIHESILGVGMFIGPLLAALVSSTGSGARGAEWTILILVLILNLGGMGWIQRKVKNA